MTNELSSPQRSVRRKPELAASSPSYLHEFTLSESADFSSEHPFQGDDRGFGIEQRDLDEGAGRCHFKARMAQRHLQDGREQPRPEPGQALCGEPH